MLYRIQNACFKIKLSIFSIIPLFVYTLFISCTVNIANAKYEPNFSSEIQRAYLKINNTNINTNLQLIKNYYNDKKVIVMLKANAYGHGIINVGRLLDKKCEYFGVASIEEAKELRENHISNKIMVFSGFFSRQQIKTLEHYNLIPVIFNSQQIDELVQHGYFKRQKNPELWIKINSGMNRLGVKEKEFNLIYDIIKSKTDNISVLTHFAESESISNDFTNYQIREFHRLIKGKNFKNISSYNSGATLSRIVEDKLSNTIRVGLSVYGISTVPGNNRIINLLPAMSVFSKVISINQLNKGDYIGYNRRYKAESKKTIAVVSFGYGDGYPQFAQDGTQVLINGVLYPIAGKISMDMMTVDITNAKKEVKIGDVVTIFDDKNLTLEDLSNNLNISPYYILTSITPRVERIQNNN